MTDEEKRVWAVHFERLERLLADGVTVLVGPTLGPVNTGIAIFDGSPLNGQSEIEASLRQIFADHPTAAYVGKIREVRFLTPAVAVLRAVVGMVSPGQSDLNPALNAVQTLVATTRDGRWRIAVFQNTPAAFHGRADLREQLTEELRQVLRGGGTA